MTPPMKSRWEDLRRLILAFLCLTCVCIGLWEGVINEHWEKGSFYLLLSVSLELSWKFPRGEA